MIRGDSIWKAVNLKSGMQASEEKRGEKEKEKEEKGTSFQLTETVQCCWSVGVMVIRFEERPF